MDANLNDLLLFCKGKSRLFLYGAGDFGATYAGILQYFGIKATGFVVTRNKKSEMFCGLPVYEIDEIINEINEYDGVVLSMSSMFQDEVKALLPDYVPVYGISHGDSVELQKMYTDKLISEKLSSIFSDLDVRNKLLSGAHSSDIFFRTITSICNDDEDDPDFVIHGEIVNLKKGVGYGRLPSFPIHDVAIVMQGPICTAHDFTLNTAAFYRKLYPYVPIVISTWLGETDESFRCACKDLDIVILENELPSEPGFCHVNYQITSSRLGIKYISDYTKAKYVLKCRTDQRINKKDFLIYLQGLLNNFLPGGDKLKTRLCFVEAHVGFPFFIADFLSFGSLSDMEKLYYNRIEIHECDYVRKHQNYFYKLVNISRCVSDRFSNYRYEGFTEFLRSKAVKNNGHTFSKFLNAELFIIRTFFNEYIENVSEERLFEQYADFLKNYVVIADNLMLYWYKYQFKLRLWRDSSENAYERWLEFYCLYH